LFYSPASPWLLGLWILWIVGTATLRNKPYDEHLPLSGRLLTLLLVVSLLVCARPPIFFNHYVLLLFPVLQLSTSAISGIFLRNEATRARFPGLCCIALACFALFRLDSSLLNWRQGATGTGMQIEARAIRDYVREGLGAKGAVVVWGWMPSVYVEDGRAPGTRHVISHFLCGNTRSATFLRRTFVNDIRTNKPEIILDTRSIDGLSLWLPATDFSELQTLLSREYTRLAPFRTQRGEVQIYRLRLDRSP